MSVPFGSDDFGSDAAGAALKIDAAAVFFPVAEARRLGSVLAAADLGGPLSRIAAPALALRR
jgi:hypothetical protein